MLVRQNNKFSNLSELYHIASGVVDAGAYDGFNNLQQFARGTLVTQGIAPRLNAISGAVANQSWGHTSEGQHRRNMPPDDTKDRPMFQGSFDEEGVENKLEAWSAGHSGYEPAYALSVRFDMWGNVVEQKEWHMDWGLPNDATLLATRTYEYDALGRRISEPGRLLYWSPDGNVIEDRASSSVVQYVWSGIGGNHLVLRDVDSDANRSTTYDPRLPAGVDERIYAITDASGSVTAITDWAGNVLERYLYTPEGKLEIRTPDMSTVRTNSGYGWGYTYHSGRRDGQGLYYVGGQVYDYLTANPVQPDPASYWGILNEMQPPSLSWYDRTVLFAAPVVAGVAGFIVGGPAGAYIAAAGVLGLTGGYNRFQEGQSALQVMGGGLADGVGAAQIYGAITNRDIATQTGLGWSGGQRVLYGTLGALQFMPVARAGAGVFNRAGAWMAAQHAANLRFLRGLGGGSFRASGGVGTLATPAAASLSGIGGSFGAGWSSVAGLGGLFGNAVFSMSRNPQVQDLLEGGAIRPTSKYRAGVSRTPRHHWLPQQDRAFFNRRGISNAEIDRLTSPLDEGIHQAIEKWVSRFGGYRDTLMYRIAVKESQYGRLLSRREVFREAAQLRRAVGLQDAKIISYGAS
jgi:hypothetical protein